MMMVIMKYCNEMEGIGRYGRAVLEVFSFKAPDCVLQLFQSMEVY